MRWITRITVDNYRAFHQSMTIEIPYGRHLLIYGENGSGKSSIYNALKDFLASSEGLGTPFTLNRFCKDAGVEHGIIGIALSNSENDRTPTELLFEPDHTKSTNRVSEIRLANKAKGFLDYKRILKAHALDVRHNEKPNIFELLIRELLCHHRVADPTGGLSTVELLAKYQSLSRVLTKTRRNARVYGQSKDELAKLDAEFLKLLRAVFELGNKFLSEYFKNGLRLDINYSNLQIDIHKRMQEKIELRVFYAEKEIDNYHTFLNEARLSAIALSLYLASVKVHPAADILRILFLDDVFIGLDMSNRIPLLEIIKNEFTTQDFQIFISTYDRQWFELAHNWFETNKCKVKTIEMFIGKGDSASHAPEYPVIVDRESGYFETAKAHLTRHDYAAAANSLRKSCEKELKRILPKQLTLQSNDETGEIIKIDNLQKLIDNFIAFIEKNNFDISPFRHIQTYKKVILNPLSHDDLEAPHYRREIEEAILLVEKFKVIQSKKIVDIASGASHGLTLGVKDKTNNEIVNYEFHLLENLHLLKQNDLASVLSTPRCNLVGDGKTRPFDSIQEAFKQILSDRGYPTTTDYSEFYKNISVNSHKKLIDIMKF